MGASSRRLGGVLGLLGRVLDPSWRVLARLGRILARLGGVLGASFGHLVRCGTDLKPKLEILTKLNKNLSNSMVFAGSGCHVGAKLANKNCLGSYLGALGDRLGHTFRPK